MAKNRDKFLSLADELEKEDPARYWKVVENLRNLEYDDFENCAFPAPKIQMALDFQKLNRGDIVDQIQLGEFDQ